MSDNGNPQDPDAAARSSTDKVARSGVERLENQLRDMDTRHTAKFEQLDRQQQQCTSSQIETASSLGKLTSDVEWIRKEREERIDRWRRVWSWIGKFLLKAGVPAAVVAGIAKGAGAF